MTTLTRRDTLALGAGAATLVALVPQALAAVDDAEAAILEFTGGHAPRDGRVTLDIPELVENGASVPISVTVDSAMEYGDRVEAILIVAERNPQPRIASFEFGSLSASAGFSTRIRLGESQEVAAIARMADGSAHVGRRAVEVTVGGCVVEG